MTIRETEEPLWHTCLFCTADSRGDLKSLSYNGFRIMQRDDTQNLKFCCYVISNSGLYGEKI